MFTPYMSLDQAEIDAMWHSGINHPIMARMHKPDPKMPPDQKDQRSVVAIEQSDVEHWLRGSIADVADLLAPPAVDLIDGGPA